IFASFPPQRCKAPHNASGCVSTTPRHTILPASSTTHTAVRLKPTSSPANILIAALLPSLEESPAERVAFPPESSNLMYGMYQNPRRLIATAYRLILAPDEPALQVELVCLDRTVPVACWVGNRILVLRHHSTCWGANPGGEWRSAALIAWCLRGSIVWRLEYWTH